MSAFEKYVEHYVASQYPNITHAFWEHISASPNLTPKFVDKHPDYIWVHSSMTPNPNFTIEYMWKHKTKRWNWSYVVSTMEPTDMWINRLIKQYPSATLSRNLRVNINTILSYKHMWVWSILSRRANITIRDVLDNPQLPWDFTELIKNRNIRWRDVTATPHLPWQPHLYAYNTNMSWDIVLANRDISWCGDVVELNADNPTLQCLDVCSCDMIYMTVSKHVTWEIIQANPQLDWPPCYVSQNPNITREIILANLHYDWCGYIVTPILYTNIQDVIAHPEYPWSMVYISKYYATIDMVLTYPHLKWDWSMLGSNLNISLRDIAANPQIPWSWTHIARRPDVTCADISEYQQLENYILCIIGRDEALYYVSDTYKQRLTRRFMEICGKELERRIGNRHLLN